MSTPAAVTDFLSLARKSGVLDEKKLLEHFPHPEDLPRDPHACATTLLRAGLLTSFQAQQLLAGKYRGFVLGAYKVLQPIGKGGMGAVFLGEHTGLKRRVALKVLPADKASEKLSLERFQREARASAALDHPNIVRLHDISQGCGVHFLVLEYVDGTDLQSLMAKTGPLHYAQAAQYIAQAAAGLQHAHEKGFVHRDIKPANLMLSKEGTIKILDMGLTRSFLNEEDNLTGLLGDTSDVAGTADYIAPEQAMNKAIDERSDIYSLGATLFSLVTGHPPFKGSTAQKLMQHQIADPPSLFKLRGVIPQALSDVVAKMMAKKPAERYQSASEVIDALGPWLPAPTTGNIVQDPFSTQDMRVSRSTTTLGGAPPTTIEKSVPAPVSGGLQPKHLALIGGGAAALLVILILGTWAILGGSSPAHTNPTTDRSADLANQYRPPQGGTPNGTSASQFKATPPVGTRPNPVAKPPAVSGNRLYAVDFAGVPVASQTVEAPGRSLMLREIDGVALPDGVHANHWNTTSSGVYSIANVNGARAIGLRQTSGTQGVQIHFKCAGRFSTLASGDTATARVTYSLDGTGDGATFVELNSMPYTKYGMVALPPTNGEWRTVDVTFVRPESGVDYDLVVRCEGTNGSLAQGTIRVRSVEVFEGLPPSPALYRANFANMQPFKATIGSSGVMTGTAPELPPGWRAEVWNQGSEGEFVGRTEDGQFVLTVSAILDKHAAQFAFDPKNAGLSILEPNRDYEARFEVRVDEGLTGYATVQNVGGDWTQIATTGLTGTGGAWKSVAVPFKLKPNQNPQFTVGPTVTLPGKSIALRGFEIVEPGGSATSSVPRTPARTVQAGKSVFALDLAAVKSFRSTFQDGQPNDPEWSTRWPSGVYAHCWKKESVAEFRGDMTDRGPALGITNLNDALSSQILIQLEGPQKPALEANKEYLVKVEYRATNDAVGKFWARLPGPDYTSVATAELASTNGQWQTIEFTFRRGEKPIELGLENTAVGEGNTLAIRAVEVFTLASSSTTSSIGTPAEGGAGVYALNLADQRPFAVKRRARDTTDLSRSGDGKTPAGWRSHSWEETCEHELFCELRDGSPVLGIRFVAGKPAGMLAVDGIAVKPNTAYKVTVGYLTPGEYRGGELRFRSSGNGGRLQIVGRLPATNGQWAEEVFTIQIRDTTNLQLEFHHNGPGGEQNPLLIQKCKVEIAQP